MLKRIVLAALLCMAAPVAANAQGFLTGVVVGGLLFGGSNTPSGTSANMIYTAPEEVLKGIDVMKVRLVAYSGCFVGSDTAGSSEGGSNYSLSEMFARITTRSPAKGKDKTVLQILRVFDPTSPRCAVIWFAYVEK